MNSQALLDVRREVARRTSERTVPVVIFAMPIQVPFVGRSEITHVALYHRHRVVFDVFGEARLDMGDVSAFGATRIKDKKVLVEKLMKRTQSKH